MSIAAKREGRIERGEREKKARRLTREKKREGERRAPIEADQGPYSRLLFL